MYSGPYPYKFTITVYETRSSLTRNSTIQPEQLPVEDYVQLLELDMYRRVAQRLLDAADFLLMRSAQLQTKPRVEDHRIDHSLSIKIEPKDAARPPF